LTSTLAGVGGAIGFSGVDAGCSTGFAVCAVSVVAAGAGVSDSEQPLMSRPKAMKESGTSPDVRIMKSGSLKCG
jgi:hypothetical protein